MDHRSPSSKENYNPRETASFFSLLGFCYNYQILKKGLKNGLQESDIYNVIPKLEAEKLGDQLEQKWREEKRRNKRKASITTCLVKCFGWTYFWYGVAQAVITTAVIILTPTIISKFIGYFVENQTEISTKDASLYGLQIFLINFMNMFLNNHLSQLIVEFSMKVRTAVCSLLYRKSLKINAVAFDKMSVGKIVTLMSKDVFSIDGGLAFFNYMVIGFLQLGVVTYVLYQKVGLSAFPAVGVIFVVIPIHMFVGRKTTQSRIKTAQKTDHRFHLLQETLSAIKIIKMYTWQPFFEKVINKARLQETDIIKKVYYLKAFIVAIGGNCINLSFYVLLMFYIGQGHNIDAQTIYYVQICLGAIKMSIGLLIPMGIAQTADMVAALQRIQEFLEADEVGPKEIHQSEEPCVHLDNVRVSMNGQQVLKSVSLNHKQGLLLISGNVASGKTILLQTILGEVPVTTGQLTVQGVMSYAPEQPWLFPSTIKQNILFGQEYNEKRYQQVLNVCSLTYDVNNFDHLDQTIVGDKGVNLSKGQQARISLARAVYRDADIYLIDDCLNCLDSHVNRHIFNECIKGFLKDKLVILVTNNINNIKNHSNVLFLEGGTTLSLDQQTCALDKRITFYMDEEPALPKAGDDVDWSEDDPLLETSSDENKNIYKEDNKQGKVEWTVYGRYFRYIGGFLVASFLVVVFAVAQGAVSWSEKLISAWVDLEPKITNMTLNNETNTTKYHEALSEREKFLNTFSILTGLALVLLIVRAYLSFYFCMNGARKLHRAMVRAMLNATMYFFDDHYIGNIVNRLSKDFHIIDEYLPFVVFDIFRLIFLVIGVLILVASVNWIFTIPAALLLVKSWFLRRKYIPTGRSLRRLEAANRSPIIGHLTSTLQGLPTIRAHSQQNLLKAEFDRHQNVYTSTFYMNQTTARFFTFILDTAAAFFVGTFIVKFMLFPGWFLAGGVGLALSQAMMLSTVVQYAVKQLTEVENVMTSVERVLEYADVKSERKVGHVVEDWPKQGKIRYSNVCLTYKGDQRTVLQNITLSIEGGSKIGIVGRTGAGKTSIISTLFRLYDYTGEIFIDDQDISNLNLDFLRSKIGIIPQDPIIFSGTVRTNIDPFLKYTDSEIWQALDKVHLKKTIHNLDQPIEETKFSSGQKQLICVARALMQDVKVVVLDEATANLDPETDQLLQKTVKQCFKPCTVICIAHKLRSVMDCDKVLVLDAGRIVEFDHPQILLRNPEGVLSRMVREDIQ